MSDEHRSEHDELIGLPMDSDTEVPIGVRAIMMAHIQFRGG